MEYWKLRPKAHDDEAMNDPLAPAVGHVEYWDSPRAVGMYAAMRDLFLGERLALASCFPRGLAGRRVLDLGCGCGRVTSYLDRMGAHVIGVDISEGMIRAARQSVPHIDFRVGDARSLEFDDESLDLVVFAFNGLDCLHPKDRRVTAIREVSRVLRPGGRFVFSHHNLAAILFGWYKYMRPRKLVFRASQILNGTVFHDDCYLPSPGAPGLVLYHAWPKQATKDMELAGLELISIYPNSILLDVLRRGLRTNTFTKLMDPWPYYVFGKAGGES